MPQQNQEKVKKFNVTVKREDMEHAVAETHEQTLSLAIKGGDPTLGFTAPEALIAALGACILSNVNKKAAAMGLQIDDASVEFHGVRRTNPLGIEPLEYRLRLTSAEPADKLRLVYEHAINTGTATNVIRSGIAPRGELHIETPSSGNGRG